MHICVVSILLSSLIISVNNLAKTDCYMPSIKNCFEKIYKLQSETPVPESLFDKVSFN